MSPRTRRVGTDELARAYFKLLSNIDWRDEVLVAGLREGLRKFLSNAHLALHPGHKYHKTHFVSRRALLRLKRQDYRGLVFEHLAPKQPYIQQPCEDRANDGTLTLTFVRSRLDKFWYLATITEEEDRLLPRVKMPADWDGTNILARYEAVGLRLIPNPFLDG